MRKEVNRIRAFNKISEACSDFPDLIKDSPAFQVLYASKNCDPGSAGMESFDSDSGGEMTFLGGLTG